MGTSGVRLSELMSAMSLATDLGFGQPSEHMLRSARIAMRIGGRLGLDTEELATLYDVSILAYVGCQAYGDEAARVFGDDIAFRSQFADLDFAGLPATLFMLRQAGAGTSTLNRARQAASLMATGGRGVVEQMANHCSAAGMFAERLGLGGGVKASLEQTYARWDGRGVPRHLAGDALSVPARVSHVATALEVLERTAGIDEALEVARSRSGTHFDPAVVATLEPDAGAIFADLEVDTLDAVLDTEPVARPPLDDEQLDLALEAIGDFCDLRCSFFAGHARGTAELAASAARLLQLPAADVALTRRAALVHDVGRFGVSGSVWSKPGPLNAREAERMRMHSYFVERIFSRPEPLRRIGSLAASHHESMDGSGYHRGMAGPTLSAPARILAAADSYHAMTQDRPHRLALTDDDAARLLRAEVTRGRLDVVAVDAVLSAAGHRARGRRLAAPADLTSRECEVLGLLAAGLPNKSIARRLAISPKTVGNHVEHIYAKLGVSNRAGAALLAMQYGLVATGEATGLSAD